MIVEDGRLLGPGMWWTPPSHGCRTRLAPPRAIVLHHTAGEGDGARIVRTLRGRGLSIHYTIDASGRVIEHADPRDTVTYHAKNANAWSVGVEIESAGIASKKASSERTSYIDTCHDRRVTYLRFFPAQVASAIALCSWLADRLSLPRLVRVERRTLTPDELAVARGVIGHMHIAPRKIDPSPHILDELADAPGWARA